MKGKGSMMTDQATIPESVKEGMERMLKQPKAEGGDNMQIETTKGIFGKFDIDMDEMEAIINRLKAEKAKHDREAESPYLDGFNWACQASYPELLFAIKYEDRLRKEGVGWLQKNEANIAQYIFTIFEYVTPEKYIDPWMDGVMRFWTAVKDQI